MQSLKKIHAWAQMQVPLYESGLYLCDNTSTLKQTYGGTITFTEVTGGMSFEHTALFFRF